MKNRATTLLTLLAANQRYHEPEVNRTTLVKQAFLVETLRPLYRVWSGAFRFVRHNYGPYSEDIFHELDTLIFNGLAEVKQFQRSGGRTEARYEITEFGRHALNELVPDELRSLVDDLVWALQSIGVDRVAVICQLVYQEPEFAQLLAREGHPGLGRENRVPLSRVTDANNQTFLVLAMIEGLRDLTGRQNGNRTYTGTSTRDAVRVFLRLLSSEIPHP